MTLSITMRAPAVGAQFIAQDGSVYTSDLNGIIAGVSPGDIESLTNQGCLPLMQRPVVTPVNSSYIVQGAINVIPSTAASTVSYAYTLAAPSALGLRTTILQAVGSTAVSTVTSSGAQISTGSVLSFNNIGSVDLEATGSTQYTVASRSPLSSLAAVASS